MEPQFFLNPHMYRPQSYDMATPLRPMYVLRSYMEPLALRASGVPKNRMLFEVCLTGTV